MGHGNSECGYFYHSGLEDDFDSEREEELPHTSSESMPPKPKTAATVALYDPKEPSGGCTGVFKQGPNDSTKRKNKKRRTAASSPNTTPVSLDAHVGNVGTHGASQSRENARQHAQKLFDTMVTRTNHVDNPPKLDEGSEEDFCKQQTFPVLQPLIDRLTQMESKVDVVTSVCARMETCMRTQNDLMLKQLEMLQTLSSENAEMRSQIILMRTLPSTDPTLKDHVLPPPPPPAPVTGGGGGGGHGDTTLVSSSTLSEGFRGGGGGTD